MRPLNCSVMRSSTAVPLFAAFLLVLLARPCAAQGVSPIAQCPADLQPIVEPSPNFPDHGEFQLSVTVTFVLDRDGSVAVPRISDSTWTVRDQVTTIPTSFAAAIVEAALKWRFPPRATPCKGSISRTFSVII